MSLSNLKDIFNRAQETTQSHPKCLRRLTKLYKEGNLEELTKNFINLLIIVLQQCEDTGKYSQNIFKFTSTFLAQTAQAEENAEFETFFGQIVKAIIKKTKSPNFTVRNHSCRYLNLILTALGDTPLDSNLCDEIEEAMLDEMTDIKAIVRVQALKAISRLQDPENVSCNVIAATTHLMNDCSSQVRSEAVLLLAATPHTWDAIKMSIRDLDKDVRFSAFQRCADIGPVVLKIIDRHYVLLHGFQEKNDQVKQQFLKYLLPKWLTAYNGDFLQFIGALVLSVDEEDLTQFTYLTEQLMAFFFEKYRISDIISSLKINDESKLINIDDLKPHSTVFWKCLVSILRNSKEDLSNYLLDVLPELTQFTAYIDKVIQRNSSVKIANEYKFCEYQCILFCLFEIAEDYDFSDEYGRRALLALLQSSLKNQNFSSKLTIKMVKMAEKCHSSTDIFLIDICDIISSLYEPEISHQPQTESQILERDFKESQMRVKLNILKEELYVAHTERDYSKAEILKNEVANYEKKLEEFINANNSVTTKKPINADELNCRALDMLYGILVLFPVQTLTTTLKNIKREILEPLFEKVNLETHWRALRVLASYCLMDKEIAKESFKIVCIPMLTCMRFSDVDSLAVVESIKGVTDLLLKYDQELIDISETSSINSQTSSKSKRTLYTEKELSNNKNDIDTSLNSILETLTELLDSKYDQIRHFSCVSLIKFALKFPFSPNLISQFILKWFNPSIEKEDHRLTHCLGLLLSTYRKKEVNRRSIEEAMLPTFRTVVEADRKSYLVMIDCDKLASFMATLLESDNEDEVTTLIKNILTKISKNKDWRIMPFLVKTLSFIKFSPTNQSTIQELIQDAKAALPNIKQKALIKVINTFIENLTVLQDCSDENAEEAPSLNIEPSPTSTQIISSADDTQITSPTEKPTKTDKREPTRSTRMKAKEK